MERETRIEPATSSSGKLAVIHIYQPVDVIGCK
jgi:hypothetical protein